MAYSLQHRKKAEILRSKGYSYLEIAKELSIAKATAYHWTKDVRLSVRAKIILEEKMTLAQIKATESNIRKRQQLLRRIKKCTKQYFTNFVPNTFTYKLICALLYWAEGEKSTNSDIRFTNSDPEMIKTYMSALRKGFTVEEDKLRALIHIHNYHNNSAIKEYWSNVTKIPLNQFNKSYLKANTEKRKRKNYKGCIRISYSDVKIAAEIRMIYNMLPDKLGV